MVLMRIRDIGTKKSNALVMQAELNESRMHEFGSVSKAISGLAKMTSNRPVSGADID